MDTLSTFVSRKGLTYAEGFMVGTTTSTGSFLTGMRCLPAEALTDDGIDDGQIIKLTETSFVREREPSLYDPPLVLVRKNERLQVGYWDTGRLAFSSTIVGIGVGTSSVAVVKNVFSRLRESHDTYRLACVLHGSKAFVAKATAILKQDIDALPFPEDDAELALSYWEQAIQDDVLGYFCEFVRRGQNSVLLRQSASPDAVKAYADLFCRLLGGVYDNLTAGTAVFLDGLICQPFYFGAPPKDDVMVRGQGEALRKLIYRKDHESLRTVRMLRFYIDNMVLIVKPDRLRFWIRSTAIRDADETIISLMEQGY